MKFFLFIVIPACPESFFRLLLRVAIIASEGFPTSGNDMRRKNITLILKQSFGDF